MASDDEDYVALGTPLEPLEEDAVVRKKPVSIQDQIVTDEQGRRRFHGAFTGGFSAGYYNTVGSKEGWTPATFKSTRKDRTAVSGQSVQDFMDEEDLGAFGIAPQRLRPTEDFTSKQREGLKRPRPTPSSGPIPGEPVLVKIIEPVVESMGVKVLRKMGWRPGQGVGPKFRKKSKRKEKPEPIEPVAEPEQEEEDAEAVAARKYGCALPPGVGGRGSDSESDSSGDENIPLSLIAPEDVNSPLYHPKENTFGLGYKGLDRNALLSGKVDLFGPSLKFRVENRNMNIAGEAFGIGVFEDADEEVYSREDMTQYDFALETPDERKRRLKGEAREKRRTKNAASSALPGFVPAKNPLQPLKVYPAPQLPPNFVPLHAVKKSRFSRNEREEDAKIEELKKQGLQRHQLSRDERRILLEENTAPEAPRQSVSFTPAVTEESAVKTSSVAAAEASQPPKVDARAEQDNVARMERLKKFAEVLQAYSSTKREVSSDSFKPFAKHPGKQERYEKYLTLKAAGFGECLKDLQPPEMTEWERERERMEFDRAANLYKPLTGEMSSRFVTAKSHDISHLVPEKEREKEKDPSQDPKVAAKMNLFGQLTHKVEEWHPDRLVSKRFNVPHPYPDSKMVGVRKVAEPSKQEPEPMEQEAEAPAPPPKKSLFADLDFSKPPPGLYPPGAVVPSTSSAAETSKLEFEMAQSTSAETAPEEVDVAPPKPPKDLFKEIFAESSSESEEEAEEQNAKTAEVKKDGDSKSAAPSSKNISKAPETKGGIFHKLDFSKLAPKTARVEGDSARLSLKTFAGNDDTEEMEEEPIYGPAAPGRPPEKIPVHKEEVSRFGGDKFFNLPSAKEVWVEKNALDSKKKKKHKKEHKSHHKSKKSKKKSSKHKKHKHKAKSSSKSHHKLRKDSSSSGDSDSDSDSSSDSNLPPVNIHHSEKNRVLIDTLKKLI